MDTIKNKWGISGSILKCIAIGSMLLDHIGASLLEVYLMNGHGNSPYLGYASWSYDKMMTWYWVDYVLRLIGRIAFPIFCFLLVEGFIHTSNRWRYARRLVIFGILSEIPFDMALFGVPFRWDHQNVLITLLLALIGMWCMEVCQKKGKRILGVLLAFGCAVLAELLHTDYGAFGVSMIVIFYLFRDNHVLRNAFGILLVLLYGGTEMWAALAFLPISLYNGKRGKMPKHFFYVFYPAHLQVLALIGMFLFPILL